MSEQTAEERAAQLAKAKARVCVSNFWHARASLKRWMDSSRTIRRKQRNHLLRQLLLLRARMLQMAMYQLRTFCLYELVDV